MPAWLFAQGGAESYMPHGMCYLWQQDLVWLHVASDTLTTLAYWGIPPVLVYFALKARHEIPPSATYVERRLPYEWMFLAFGAFIVACGATHAMGIWTIWEPRYWLEGGIKAVTAAASVATAIALPPLVPRALEVIREARESEVRRVELEEAHQEQDELVRRLRDANQAKSHFLANVSHDLRTPLSLVLGPVEEMLDRDLPPDVEEQLETVRRNARTLSSQVENLLTVGKMESEPLEADPRRTDLAATVREAAEHYVGHAHGRGIDFRLDVPEAAPCRADPDLLERAVLNLLSNAFKFTPDGGSVRCAVRGAGDGNVEVVVADSGPGVPEAERDAVFERFRRSEEAGDRSDGGTGLGLAIVKEVAEAHRGSVRVDGAPEGGARFVLRLPVRAGVEGELDGAPAGPGDAGVAVPGEAAPDEPEPATVAGPVHPAREEATREEEGGGDGDGPRRPTVLLVEDDADMARHLGGVLSAEYRVAFAADGRQGLERAVELRPDLVVTDMMMPEMDGAEMVSALRDRPELSGIPILVLTARAEEELPERMLREGAQDYVIKPVRRGELLARIENLIDLTGSRRLLQESLASGEESLQQLARMAVRRKEKLEEAVQEKKVLMRELHHRVKGNLQTITSLLQLQMRSVEDEGARRSLEESRGRVATMGLLHEKLYGSGRPERVELSGYLRSLVAEVVRTRGAESEVRTSLALEDVEVGVDRAVAYGLIVHELVTNALRHAFPGDAGGTVEVELRRIEDELRLVVADDGRGIDEAEMSSADSLGMRLVDSLVGQLDGRTRVEGDGGTRVEVVFPATEPDAGGRSALDRDGGG